MKRIICAAAVVSGLLSAPLIAQRGGGGGGGGVGGGGRPGMGAPVRPFAPPFAGRGLFRQPGQRRFPLGNYGTNGGYGLPLWDNLADGSGDAYPANCAVEPPPAADLLLAPRQQPPEPPAAPPQPVIYEFNWPPSSGDTGAPFSIVSKDGKERLALAVWLQDNALHYTGTDGISSSVAVSQIDREVTYRRNAEKHLTLRLPSTAR